MSRVDVPIAVNQEVPLDATLDVAAIAETVEVSVSTPLVEPTRADLSSRVGTATIDALPLNGRNFEDLIALVPGTKSLPSTQQGEEVSIFGERPARRSPTSSTARDNNDPLNGGAVPALHAGLDPGVRGHHHRLRGASSAAPRAASSTSSPARARNDSQARAFYFSRDDALDSSNVAGPGRADARAHQWGGTLGGPIVADKAFFFGSFEVLDETRGRQHRPLPDPGLRARRGSRPLAESRTSVSARTPTASPASSSSTVNLSQTNQRSRSRSTAARGRRRGEISSPIAGTIALPSAAAAPSTGSRRASPPDAGRSRADTFLETNVTLIDGTTRQQPRPRRARSSRSWSCCGAASSRLALLSAASSSAISIGSQLAQAFTLDPGRDAGRPPVQAGLGLGRTPASPASTRSRTTSSTPRPFSLRTRRDVNEELFERLGFEQSAARFFYPVRESGREPRPRHRPTTGSASTRRTSGGRGRT